MAGATTATTEAPGGHKPAGFPPFKTETFPSQFFWLAITFAFLFVVLWRVAGPRIAGTLAARRGQINGDIAEAQKNRSGAQAAEVAYQTALAAARARAQSLAEANRKEVSAGIDAEKAAADAKAQEQVAQAEARIASTRDAARTHVVAAAQDAAIAIVAQLTGETVSQSEAASAVAAVTGA